MDGKWLCKIREEVRQGKLLPLCTRIYSPLGTTLSQQGAMGGTTYCPFTAHVHITLNSIHFPIDLYHHHTSMILISN
uniref:Uncharacterized protein n=1 Tax=Physcomitrium patens TaxID=3218 RepID=A0A2K1J499_PHYPA|nr:hypothetical protein PHYPA_022202 [Physcomitrium patens]